MYKSESTKPKDYLSNYVGPRDGHTARHKGIKDDSKMLLSYYKPTVKLNANAIAIPLTAIDEIEPEQYVANNWRNRSICAYTDACIVLNKKHLCEIVPKLLEANCISKKTRRIRSMFKDSFETIYDLPVTGEKIMTVNTTKLKKQEKSNRYLYFKGKKYDRRLLYYSTSPGNFQSCGEFKLVDNEGLSFVNGTINLRGKFDSNAININWLKQTQYDYWVPREDNYTLKFQAWTHTDKLTSIDIKLPKETAICAISTLGRKYHVSTFPNYGEAKDLGIPFSHEIKYVTEKEQHYVTTYEIQYKTNKSKWISLGIFAGNKDRLTEVRHKFDSPITARQIRIIPKTYHGSPSMQIALFTMGKEEKKSTTVEYRLEYPSKSRYVVSEHRCIDYYKRPNKRLELRSRASKDRNNSKQLLNNIEYVWNPKKSLEEVLYINDSVYGPPVNFDEFWMTEEELFVEMIESNMMGSSGEHLYYCRRLRCRKCAYDRTGIVKLTDEDVTDEDMKQPAKPIILFIDEAYNPNNYDEPYETRHFSEEEYECLLYMPMKESSLSDVQKRNVESWRKHFMYCMSLKCCFCTNVTNDNSIILNKYNCCTDKPRKRCEPIRSKFTLTPVDSNEKSIEIYYDKYESDSSNSLGDSNEVEEKVEEIETSYTIISPISTVN